MRTEKILKFRGDELGLISEQSSQEEQFQNRTLRPILKFQNDLLLESFKNYFNKQKNVFYNLTLDKKMNYIDNAVQKDIKFRNSLKGIVLGLFTVEEYKEYIKNSSNLNKRLMSLLIERIKSQIQLFEIVK
jgi:hypothetical protein